VGKLKLTLACNKYDYLQQLREREIQPDGIDLNLITVESGPRHQRMYQYGEYDACEFSLSSYLVAKSQGVTWFQAIPFFPRRMFSHKFCLVRSGSGIRMPSDLRGPRIGLRSYENTLALATKGMFHNTYGLSVTDVTWVVSNKEPVGSKLPPAIKVEQAERTCKLEDLLLLG
jgi:4,5-dihydroxyphthalate decarboxylase